MHVITDALIESMGMFPDEIPLEYGAYEGDEDAIKPRPVGGCCPEESDCFCTRAPNHTGLHVASGAYNRIIVRWK